jgi:hypothetical protein
MILGFSLQIRGWIFDTLGQCWTVFQFDIINVDVNNDNDLLNSKMMV